VLLVWGYGLARQQPVVLWNAARGHAPCGVAADAGFVCAAGWRPMCRATCIKAKLHHPMVLAVKVWALGHLLANGNLADVVLFGSFLLWAVLRLRAARGRDRAAGTTLPRRGGGHAWRCGAPASPWWWVKPSPAGRRAVDLGFAVELWAHFKEFAALLHSNRVDRGTRGRLHG
jgi:hypothetical protein